MSKYHAAQNGKPLCGANGSARGFNVIALSPPQWNDTPKESRCLKCIEALKQRARMTP